MNSGNKDFDKGKRFSDSQNKRPPPAGRTLVPPPVPVPPAGPNAPPSVPPPPHNPAHLQNERLRARFELDSAYRDLRRGELIVQQIETYLPSTEEMSFGRKLLDIASEIYQSAYRNHQKESFFKAAEYSVAVKDVMRGIDKFYNTAGPYPIYPESEENKT